MMFRYLSTSLAHVGLLASVHARVDCQRRALDELLAATCVIAHVWPNTTVDTLCHCILAPVFSRDETQDRRTMTRQVTSPREALIAC